MVLASKFGKHPALWMTDDPTGGATVYTPAMIEEALHTSLASLQTDVIDLYQGGKTRLVTPFYTKNDYFAKTGSGQT